MDGGVFQIVDDGEAIDTPNTNSAIEKMQSQNNDIISCMNIMNRIDYDVIVIIRRHHYISVNLNTYTCCSLARAIVVTGTLGKMSKQ